MSKYPFKEKADEFMDSRKGCIAELSWKGLDRRYRRMERELIMLKEQGAISTLSPQKMGEDDIKAFLVYRKGKKVSASDLSHDISALNQLLSFCGNPAVVACLNKNIGLKPKHKQQPRLEPLSKTTYEEILGAYHDIDFNDFTQVRAFTLVLMYIGTGARNKELRLTSIDDVDVEEWKIHFEHVKGEGTYGSARNVPIPVELRSIVEQYIFDRAVWLKAHDATSEALFFQLGGGHTYLSGNSIRRCKSIVEKKIGKTFELRDCRRAFGQFYINKGLEIDGVSILMGHGTTRTTEQYYCRKNESEVIERAKELW